MDDGMLEDGPPSSSTAMHGARHRMIAMYIGLRRYHLRGELRGRQPSSALPARWHQARCTLHGHQHRPLTQRRGEAVSQPVKWLTNAENTVYFATKTGYLPVTYSGLSPEFQGLAEANPHKAAIANLRPLNTVTGAKIAAWEECRGIIYEMVTKVFLGEDIDMALAEGRMLVEEAIDAMLSERF